MPEPSPSPEALAFGRPAHGWRRRGFVIIFESDTPAGRRFDLALLAAIAASVVVVVLESVQPLADRNTELFLVLEWGFTWKTPDASRPWTAPWMRRASIRWVRVFGDRARAPVSKPRVLVSGLSRVLGCWRALPCPRVP